MNKKTKILVGTPAYNGQLQVAYVRSLLDMTASKIDFSLFTVANDSLVARARNTIVAMFHAHPEFTHLFCLDADVGIQGKDVLKLISHGKDVIGAPVRIKVEGNKPAFSVGDIVSRDGTLASVTRIGTAALLLSRHAVNQLVELAVSAGNTYPRDSLTLGESGPGMHYDVFRQGVRKGVYVSEDYQACLDLQSLGFDIYADLGIRTQHFGMHEFSG